jgi:hypothetical protein
MVARLTPSSRAIEETVLSGLASRSRGWRICLAVRAGGRPRRAPEPRAASSPSWVALDDQLAESSAAAFIRNLREDA